MDTPKHTPGPWTTHHDIYVWDGCTNIARTIGPAYNGRTNQENEAAAHANARLIAAAPDLLDSAQKLLSSFASGDNSFYDHRHALEAAVAKAAGREVSV